MIYRQCCDVGFIVRNMPARRMAVWSVPASGCVCGSQPDRVGFVCVRALAPSPAAEAPQSRPLCFPPRHWAMTTQRENDLVSGHVIWSITYLNTKVKNVLFGVMMCHLFYIKSWMFTKLFKGLSLDFSCFFHATKNPSPLRKAES